ncbi:general stress protein 13 [Kurthia zopfii]|uniref:General stress protein 13 n=1 Tax=Kurthia zopfii TaxID=1650 RepID=A0A2U3AG97_9BACL|nr:S1 domain-containing post-transcriptional regulator GSP13 [Kurthia zopfii]PWI23578.1 general stress protein 13 [Kurthia zopfii]TDR42743.1 general stress protein 13 [Kurthia zopfii]STX10420.1 General stress protein 13 [Kurthia zopfii]VEI08636.1 General stress protein 13 [Kurthia zopfii]GEK30216.1 general stress protein 13 [Kurthia zopfii]
MSNKYKVGDVVTGKVTGIQPYGAFVSLDEQTQGLVHISEITYGFVKSISEFISVGDTVTVQVLEVEDPNKKISLSIRALREKPQRKKELSPRKSLQNRVNEQDAVGFNSLKEKLNQWIEESGIK